MKEYCVLFLLGLGLTVQVRKYESTISIWVPGVIRSLKQYRFLLNKKAVVDLERVKQKLRYEIQDQEVRVNYVKQLVEYWVGNVEYKRQDIVRLEQEVPKNDELFYYEKSVLEMLSNTWSMENDLSMYLQSYLEWLEDELARISGGS
ncbi:hypothetical protein RUM44_002138 [Polyplax serrata]|uniref:Uncharacterized protein n=1 Tax=Polyplax serrata TaxID=468196 RepID=A0ABR1AMP8_POLSC